MDAPTVIFEFDTPELSELQVLARGAISRRFARHYAGFFKGCCREHELRRTAKTMLYSYRAALTGVHLLRTGDLEANLLTLAPKYGFDDVADLAALEGIGCRARPAARSAARTPHKPLARPSNLARQRRTRFAASRTPGQRRCNRGPARQTSPRRFTSLTTTKGDSDPGL